ncbi:MAG TPA: META domain-containing protein, partial [Allosphingosinicella sp.]
MATLKHLLPPLLAALSACTMERPASPGEGPATETYRARGQEPGWALTIAEGMIDYRGNYGEKRIAVPRPDPRTTFNGHRYETPRLTVDVTHGRCNDAMSGHGYADQVVVIADGETYRGCGG